MKYIRTKEFGEEKIGGVKMSYLNDYDSNKGITETLDDFDRKYINVEELIDYMNKRIEYLEKLLSKKAIINSEEYICFRTRVAEIHHWLEVLNQRQRKGDSYD